MGASETKLESENFVKTLNENISNTIMSVANQSSAVIKTSQSVKHLNQNYNCAGDITVNNSVRQTSMNNLNFSKLSENISSTKLSSMLKTAIKKSIENDVDVKSEFASPTNNVTDTDKNITDVTNKIVSNYSYSEFQEALASASSSQDAEFVDINANHKDYDISKLTPEQLQVYYDNQVCNFDNSTVQNMSAHVIASNISKTLIEKIQSGQIDLTQNLTKKSDVKVTNEGVGSAVKDALEGVAAVVESATPWKAIIAGVVGFIFLVILIIVIIYIIKTRGSTPDLYDGPKIISRTFDESVKQVAKQAAKDAKKDL